MTPDDHTNKEFYIDVGNGHRLYVHDWGNPKGLPIIFLHGGPGAMVRDGAKMFFDPAVHHVVFFDQRGCGKSLPYGSLKHNTTADMVEDVTKIADEVKFKQFVIAGGSWGACLGLVYGIKNPKRVKAMVLRGIFTGSQKEIGVDFGFFDLVFQAFGCQKVVDTPADVVGAGVGPVRPPGVVAVTFSKHTECV